MPGFVANDRVQLRGQTVLARLVGLTASPDVAFDRLDSAILSARICA